MDDDESDGCLLEPKIEIKEEGEWQLSEETNFEGSETSPPPSRDDGDFKRETDSCDYRGDADILVTNSNYDPLSVSLMKPDYESDGCLLEPKVEIKEEGEWQSSEETNFEGSEISPPPSRDDGDVKRETDNSCLLYTSPSPRDS